MELSKDKRPTEHIIWEGSPEELDEWLERVLQSPAKKKKQEDGLILLTNDIIEG